jgi:UPF0755 protein
MIDTYTPRKGRKKWPFFVVLLFVLLGAGLFGMVWYQDNLKAPSIDASTKVFVIQPNEAVPSISSRLQDEGLIKNSLAFRIYLRLSGQDSQIQTGDFKLRANMTASEIAENLHTGAIDIWVTLLEGWRVEEIAVELKKKLGVDETEFLNVAKEGYMFPDTYLIPRDASASEVAQMLENNFNKRLADNSLSPAGGNRDLSFEEKIILASIVERESKGDLEEKATIAGILLNRIRQDMALQADATIQYDRGNPENWWPTLTPDEYTVDSPSNTYTRPGLPPGPIANPGIDSIKAAFSPQSTDFLYYIHAPDGQIYYARTLDEHNANVAEYLR